MTGRTNQSWFLFLLGLAVFATLAGLGWNKLQYGMNFIDEGMYMTDGWRLAAGDSLFPDSSPSAVRMYAVFNAQIFNLWPDISLLGFRRLQFFASLISVLALGTAVYRVTREYWYLPWVMSVFAFTGLDAVGMSSNMSYYTYPHLFITLHVAALLFAVTATEIRLRTGVLVLSGIFLWAAGFSFLPLAVAGAAPLLLWGLFRALGSESTHTRFSFRDALLVTAPVAVIWAAILLRYNMDFFNALADLLRYFGERSSGEPFGPTVTQLQYFGVAFVLLALGLAAVWVRNVWSLAFVGVVAISTFLIIDTDFFGLVAPYWKGWFSAPMWFSMLLVAFVVIEGLSLSRLRWRQEKPTENDRQILFLIVPSALAGAAFVMTSGMGPLAICYVSIPLTVALAMRVVRINQIRESGIFPSAVAVCAILSPFYYTLAWNDWRFTYFDLSPKYLDQTIDHGFAKGIKTNKIFAVTIDWIEEKTAKYSSEGDYAIFYDQVPMGYMLARRRPSLDHSWAGMALSSILRRESVEKMVRLGRDPAIAFRFHHIPYFYPVSLKEEKFELAGQIGWKPDDPLNAYVTKNMKSAGTAKVQEQDWLEVFVKE